jgi:hypothetical protein
MTNWISYQYLTRFGPGGGMSLPRTPNKVSNSASSSRSDFVARSDWTLSHSFRTRLR